MDILIEELDSSLWAAAVQDGRLEDLEVDPANEEVRYGSIYWGRVARIDKAMDAAYIDLDGDNTGLLHNADIRLPDKPDKKSGYRKGGDKEIGQILRPGQMVIVQAKSSYAPSAGESAAALGDDEQKPRGKGQEGGTDVIDQALFRDKDKESKCAVVSMEITLPGRFLIYSPMMSKNRISMRIRDKKLRRQLNKMLNAIENIQGCILRAAASHTQTDVLIREGKVLKEIWRQLQQHFSGEHPQLIMLGPDATQRILSDQAASQIETIEVVTMEQYQNVEEWCEIYAPDLVTRVTPVELADPHADLALFEHRAIMDQIETLFWPYTLLPGGSNIIIQETAALTAIDVNRGADTSPALDVNLHAAEEIARQLRLRNLGGIVLIDFLKMKNRKTHARFIDILNTFFADDPCTVQIHGLTNLGLLELTRKRRTPPLQAQLETALTPDEHEGY